MDHILDADGGFIRYHDLRSAVAERISLEMTDPEVWLLRNLRRMTVSEIKCFDPFAAVTGNISAVGYPEDDGLVCDSSADKRNMPRAPKSYHYKIGKCEESTYYCQFLSDSHMWHRF